MSSTVVVSVYVARREDARAVLAKDTWLPTLTPEERAHADALSVPARREDFVITRAMLRLALSRNAPLDPRSWRLGTRTGGAPFVDAPNPRDARISVSHARSALACAIADGVPVGVDVEDEANAAHAREAADEWLSPHEQAARAAGDADLVARWAMKEAISKALGQGLALDFKRVRLLHHDDDARGWSIAGSPHDGGVIDDVTAWTLVSQRLEGATFLATAVNAAQASVRVIDARELFTRAGISYA